MKILKIKKMNQKINTKLGIAIIIIMAITVGIFIKIYDKIQQIGETPQQAVDIKKVELEKMSIPDVRCNTTTNQEKTEEIITTYKYKEIKVSDGYVEFSFQIPETWLSETRHSGDKKLSIEEMREFLATNYNGNIKTNPELTSDYADLPWFFLKDMPGDEVINNYTKSEHPFPNASVSAGNEIWYTDSNGKQIDFYIFHNFDSLSTYWNEIYKLDNNNIKYTKSTELIDEVAAEVITSAMDKNECGNETATKRGSGGKIYFILLNDGKDMLIINKQSKGDLQFEDNFIKLLKTLKIDK